MILDITDLYFILFTNSSGRAVWGVWVLGPLEHCDHWFESSSRFTCVCVFLCCVVLCR